MISKRSGWGFLLLALGAVLAVSMPVAAQQQATFSTPEEASAALIDAAERFDLAAFKRILRADGMDLVITEDEVQARNQAAAFAAQARGRNRIDRDPKNTKRALLLVGVEEWPMPIPLVEKGGAWRFDTQAGRQEILFRRIGENELDAIEVCRGYVEAQNEYASEKRGGSPVNQYAQRVVSTPGRHDGLAWRDSDGTWQGPAAPFGEMNFVVGGVMIGGFALVAAPAEYGVTGVKTFIVSHAGVVYEKDLGPKTLDTFRSMTRFDPDPSWSPVPEP